ncbi:MAG: thiamine ABC transporter substrate binding subunit [Candidatus Competibacteraceae bacterium]|nr:thiamine ABC transporter substrate binding subunit [Candidatus Competibacteraceae bacterium]
MRVFALVSGWLLTSLVWAQPVLTVYTYNSFTADWGPGPAIEQAFEAECNCDLKFIGLEDGVALLSRIRLEGANSKADIVLGLDNNLLADAAASGLFVPHELDLSGLQLPVDWADPIFVPFDYGYFAFVYKPSVLSEPPQSLADLLASPAEQKILIQDPRTSTPGLGLLLWLQAVYGEQAQQAWQQLRPHVLTVSKGWSEAYGLFLKGEAPLVLSYTTSPAYHRIAEDDQDYAAARFSEGHYLQIEVAGRLQTAPQPELARQFLQFMIGPGFQSKIATGNWMYPVIDVPLPEGFDTPPSAAETLLLPAADIKTRRKQWVNEWLEVMSQ